MWDMVSIKNVTPLPSSHYTRFVMGMVLSMILWWGVHVVIAQELLLQSAMSTPQEIAIDMESYAFMPSEITIDAGQAMTLTLHNQSFLVPHNFLLDDPHGARVLEADISSGESQSFSMTLTEPGVYPFYCEKQLFFFPSHREEGMEGRLIVR